MVHCLLRCGDCYGHEIVDVKERSSVEAVSLCGEGVETPAVDAVVCVILVVGRG